MNIHEPGLMGGIAGGVLGLIGGLIGMYAALRHAKTRCHRRRIIRYSLTVFLLAVTYAAVAVTWRDSVVVSLVATVIYLAILLLLSIRPPRPERDDHDSVRDHAA